MAKYYGEIGFSETTETSPGVWTESLVKRFYQGEVTRNTRRYNLSNDGINDNLNISNDISIVADPYAIQNFHKIRYITYMGSKWKINNVEVNFPRLILHISDLYNEEKGVD